VNESGIFARRGTPIDVARSAVEERMRRHGLLGDEPVRLMENATGIYGLFAFRHAATGEHAWITSRVDECRTRTFVARSLPMHRAASDAVLARIAAELRALRASNAYVRELAVPDDETRIEHLDGPFYRACGATATALLLVVWDAGDGIKGIEVGYGFGAPERERARTSLAMHSLPLSGPATIVWGGRSLRTNAHAGERSQRYAVDLEPDGAERDVVAPVGGVVVHARDGVPDNPAGGPVRVLEDPFGNHAVIRTVSGHDVVLCHFQRGTLRVHTGQHVTAGARIALVGNSGLSAIPHLHVHAEETAAPCHGVPMTFPGPNGPVELERGAHVEPAR
jgi:murein DD-endopeptidase MepM/ murein hydrolase activator NlpD